ncbi:MAG: SDR family oxidoreductase [Natronospirillum sp.]
MKQDETKLTERVLITGANGFVGKYVLAKLALSDSQKIVRAALRSSTQANHNLDTVEIGDIARTTDWQVALNDVSVVVHTAARAHIMSDEVADPLAEYRRVNVEGTLSLARQAAQAGIRRFVFISSIGVNGISNMEPFTVDDVANPVEPYAVSKLEAEIGLRQLAEETSMEVVIIRPPLVYGRGAPGNFGRLAALARKNLPLPLGAIHNQRSLVGIDNLMDLIVTCIDHPAAANETFLVSDGRDLSTTELLRLMTQAAGKSPRLIPVPMKLITLGATLLGKKAIADRLCGSLRVDITHTKATLGWQPPVSVEEGIKRCFE